MKPNPYMKPLRQFDPKKDLIVDERFTLGVAGSGQDAFSDLMGSENSYDAAAENLRGKEAGHFRTSDAITADIVLAKLANQDYAIVGNKKGALALLPLTSSWQDWSPAMQINIPGTIFQAPVTRDDMLYVLTREGALYSIRISEQADKLTGKMIWKKGFNKGILSQPILTRKMLLVASFAGIYAFDVYGGSTAQGKMIWHHSLKGVVATPLYVGGQLFVASEEKKLYAFGDNGNNVSEQWIMDTQDAIRSRPLAAQSGNFLLTASIDGTVYFIDRTTGKTIWIFSTPSSIYANPMSFIRENRESFIFGDDAGIVYCLDSNGKERWRYQTQGKIRSEAIEKNGVIYIGSFDNYLYAIDADSGKLNYRFATEGNIYSKPVIWQDFLMIGSGDGFVYIINV